MAPGAWACLPRAQACVRRAAAAAELSRARAAAELLLACARRALERRRGAAIALQAGARRIAAEAYRHRLLSAQYEKRAFRKQSDAEVECIALLEKSTTCGSVSTLRGALSQAESLGIYHCDAAIRARQALSVLTRNHTTVKGATMQLEHALEEALFSTSGGLEALGQKSTAERQRAKTQGELVSVALGRCRQAGMGLPHIQRVTLPFLKRAVREANERSLSALDLVAIQSSISSLMQGGEEGGDRDFHEELLRPTGVRPKFCYQTRRRTKHLFRLEHMLFLAEHVLRIGGGAVDMCLNEARATLQDLQIEVSSLLVLSSVELYDAREKERRVIRQRQLRRAQVQGDASPESSSLKTSLSLDGDAGDWKHGVWPLIKTFGVRRGLLGVGSKAQSKSGGGSTAEDENLAVQKMLAHWPPSGSRPSKRFHAADGLSYQLSFSEEQRQRTCQKGEGLLYLRRHDSKLTAVEVAFVVTSTWKHEQHMALSSAAGALQCAKEHHLIGYEIRRAEERIDTMEEMACAQHRALHGLDTAMAGGQLQRLESALKALEECGLGSRLRELGCTLFAKAEKCVVSGEWKRWVLLSFGMGYKEVC
jgi:hypothetical protein